MTDSAKPYDVAVLGWWYGKNYGSILTYYGLNRAITDLGKSVLMVHESLGYNGYRVQWPDDILSLEFARRMGYRYTEQQHYGELPQLNTRASTFVVGSDQLWNPRIGRVNSDLFLDFVGDDNQRVAYGTSFGDRGASRFTDSFVSRHARNLRRFKSISVREDYAIEMAKDVFGVDATQVVDPVFLLSSDHYGQLADAATFTPPEGDFLTVFLLDPTEAKRDAALTIASKLGLEQILLVPNPDRGREAATALFDGVAGVTILPQDGPENFLRAYRDCSYVFTDSFHGSAFACIFHKPFSSIYNKQRGPHRFTTLLTAMGLAESRRVSEHDIAGTIEQNDNVSFDIDFGASKQYIEQGRSRSIEWLKSALDTTRDESAARTPITTIEIKDPVFTANSPAWEISNSARGTRLAVGSAGGGSGQHVWTDLPESLIPGAVYELTFDWTVRTRADSINIHSRDAKTGKFAVIAKIDVSDARKSRRTDSVTVRIPASGRSQIMLGAVHFSGRRAGVLIHSLKVQQVTQLSRLVPKPDPTGFDDLAKSLAIADYERQASAFEHSKKATSVTGARARLFFHAHAIEKGLTHSNFRPGFGRIAVPGMAKEMNAWLARGLGTDDVLLRSSAAVMKAYFDRNKESATDVSHFWEQFSAESQHVIDNGPYVEGGVLPASAERETTIVTPNDDSRFMDIMYGRRSIREFTADPVSDEDIAMAVNIAMQAPSVCSRQGGRVHQFDDPQTIEALLEIQGGFVGFAMPPRLLLVTADLEAFLFASERNQPYVDGGLFMMSLLLGLTQVGLGSCLLNTAMATAKEAKIRDTVDIGENEVMIAFVAVGHHDTEVLVPRSKRLEAESILTRHPSR